MISTKPNLAPPKLASLNSILSLTIFILVSSYSNQTHASFKDPCSIWSGLKTELTSESDLKKLAREAANKIANFFDKDYLSALDLEEKKAHFTRKAGFYFTLNCSNPADKNRLLKSGIFGVGELFYPEGKRKFSDGTYYYGTKSTGLKAFVHSDFLRAVEKGKNYFFNPTSDDTYICTNKINCEGDPKRFSARNNYATNFDLSIKDEGPCKETNVDFFIGSKSLADGPEFSKRVTSITYCPNNQDEKANGIIRYDFEKANSLFEKLAIKGEYFYLASKKARDLVPHLFTKKDCDTKVEVNRKNFWSFGGSLGVDTVIKIEAGGELKHSVSVSEVFDADKQYIFHSYSADLKALTNVSNAPHVNDLIIVQNCNGKSIPEQLHEVRINILLDEDKAFTIDTEKLESIAQDRLAELGLLKNLNDELRARGYTWTIADVKQKHQWREVLFGLVSQELSTYFTVPTKKKVYVDFVYYFTDLILATSFYHTNPTDLASLDFMDHSR